MDLNQAPGYLLSYISGINSGQAKKIVDWRKKNGEFKTRQDLLKIKGIGEKAFEQCAGFVRIMSLEKK